MQPEIRKIVAYDEEVLIEGFRPASLWRMCSVAPVVNNAWAQRDVEDLKPEILADDPILGELLKTPLIAGGGKTAMVDRDAEVEHASVLIHTLPLDSPCRQAVQAKPSLSVTISRGPTHGPILVSQMNRNDAGRRQGATSKNEIVGALAAATSGRPHHRIGDRTQHLKDLGHDLDNPAAV